MTCSPPHRTQLQPHYQRAIFGCCYSDWIETDDLENTLSSTVVNATRRQDSAYLKFATLTAGHSSSASSIRILRETMVSNTQYHHHITHKEMGELRPQ